MTNQSNSIRHMKWTFFTILFTFVSMTGLAQDANTCKRIAEHILTAAQNHKPDGIEELLASDFHFNNIKQPLAAKVLK